MIFPRGFVYIVNKIRLSTWPWGTTYFNVTGVDVHDPNWTVFVRSSKYVSNHLRAEPLILKVWFNKFNNSWWFIVSNAALRSSSTKWPLPYCPLLGGVHFAHGGLLFLCCEVVCKQTEIFHTSCWFSDSLLIEHKHYAQQSLKWKIGQTQAYNSQEYHSEDLLS